MNYHYSWLQCSIGIKRYYILFLLLLLSVTTTAQQGVPEVIFQSGFMAMINTEFRFSQTGRYLVGNNDVGEYIVWDSQTGKQIKKIAPIISQLPGLIYEPHSAFSKDERFMLIPEFPQGNYILYDLQENRTVKVFKPKQDGECYTHAAFSANGEKVMLLGQRPGNTHFSEVVIYNTTGTLLRRSILDIPLPSFTNNLLLKLILNRMMRFLQTSGAILGCTTDDNFDHLYVVVMGGKAYEIDLNNTSAFYSQNEFKPIRGFTDTESGTRMSLYKDKLIISGHNEFKKLDSAMFEIRDTAFIVNIADREVEKKVCSKQIGLLEKFRSSGLATLPTTNGQNNDVVFSYNLRGGHDYEITARDILSGAEVMTFKSGKLYTYQTRDSYRAGQLNGGYIVAISPDHQYEAECTREIVIQQLAQKQVRSVISAARGQFKLAAPLFLDSTHMLIPKMYNDGFVFNTATGRVDQLNREIDCQDTVHNGGNVFYAYDNTMQIGIQNAVMLPGTKEFMMANVIPNDLCNPVNNKEITIWDRKTLSKKGSYLFKDREFTYFLSGMAGFKNRFLINYKLVNFSKPDNPLITPLYIRQKRDTFYAVNPIYLPGRKQIFSIAATRSKAGNPNLFFALWDADGKLVKSYAYRRPGSKLEYQGLVYESQLSPDSTKLLFGLYDGTAGIFDLKKMEVTSTYEHGQSMEISIMHLFVHNNITAGCFIDNDHFVTNGDNNAIYLWTVGQSKPDRIINRSPMYLLSLTLSPDKKHLVGVSLDKTVYFINIQTGLADVDFIASSKDAYTILDKNGFYISNKKSVNDISFLYKGQGYEFAQFDMSLHRPDKVLQTLGSASPADIAYLELAWKKRINRLNYHPAAFDKLAEYNVPTLALKTPGDVPSETQQPLLNLQLIAKDKAYPVNRLMVTVNGVPLFGADGLKINKLNKSEVVLPLAIPLSAGHNQVTLSVLNQQGTESLQRTIDINRIGAMHKPDLYIIAVGSGMFPDTRKNLKYAVKDARDVVKLFKERATAFEHIFIDTLFNQRVTTQNLLKLKSKLLLSHPDDMVMVYFAGHGILDDKLDYYLSTYSINFNKPAQNGMPYEKMQHLLDSIPARGKLLLVDACFSGEVDKDNPASKTSKTNSANDPASANQINQQRVYELMQTYFSDLRKSNGASEIGAAGPSERAQEVDELQNGVFTFFLKKALHNKEADINKDGSISVSELADYLKDHVASYTEAIQKPTLRNQNIINDLVIWN